MPNPSLIACFFYRHPIYKFFLEAKNGCDFLGHCGTKWEIKLILDGAET
jgi:hypothetical protein